jgi:hypothetical protein
MLARPDDAGPQFELERTQGGGCRWAGFDPQRSLGLQICCGAQYSSDCYHVLVEPGQGNETTLQSRPRAS